MDIFAFFLQSKIEVDTDPFSILSLDPKRRKEILIMRFIYFITAAVSVSTALALDAYFLCPYKTEGKCCLHVNLTSGTSSLCTSPSPLPFPFRFPILPFNPIQVH